MTPVFIVFLAITLIGSVWLLLDRRKFIKSSEGDDSLISGTGTFIAVNLLLVLSAFFIFVGTTLPVFTNIVPAKSYFNIVNLPLFLLTIALAGVCVLVGWKMPDLKRFKKQLIWPLVLAILVVIALVIGGVRLWYAVVAIFILAAVFVATLVKWGSDVAARMRGKKENCLLAFWRLFIANRSRYGGYIIHIAVAVLALGVIGSSAYKSQTEQTLNVGDTLPLGGYTLKYNGFDSSSVQKSDGSVWLTVIANMDISRDGKALGTVHPSQVLQFTYSGQTITNMSLVSNKVAIRSNLARDYYVIFEDFDGTTNQGLVMVIINPLVEWIWIGGALLLIGGLVSFSAATRKVTAPEDKD
jgi:cytochrome c-type biogenesis protein CcmF